VSQDEPEIVQKLIKAGAEVSTPIGHSRVLPLAASFAMLGLLLDAGANIDTTDGRIHHLERDGPNENSIDRWGSVTALKCAARKGKEEIVQFLLVAGADVEAIGH
jgi:ankyrin repeat protein